MSPPVPKIEFFRVRSAGERITATIDFLRENRRTWLWLCALPVIPFCLLLGWLDARQVSFTVWDVYAPYPSFDLMEFLFGFSLSGHDLLSLTSGTVLLVLWTLFTAIGTMLYLYEHRTRRLSGVAWAEWKLALSKSVISTTVVTILAFLLFYLICHVRNELMQLFLLGVTLPMALFVPSCLIGRSKGIAAAAGRAFSLGFNTWAGILLTCAGLALVIFCLRGTSEMLVSVSRKVLSTLVYTHGFSSLVTRLLLTFSYTCCYWVAFLSLSVLMIAGGYLYGHAEEKFTLISLDDDIRRFENL